MNTPLNIQTCKRIAHLFPNAEYWWVYCLMDNQWHITDTNPTGSKPTKKYTDEHYPCPSLEELIEKLPEVHKNIGSISFYKNNGMWCFGNALSSHWKDSVRDKDPKVACAKLLMKLEGIDE